MWKLISTSRRRPWASIGRHLFILQNQNCSLGIAMSHSGFDLSCTWNSVSSFPRPLRVSRDVSTLTQFHRYAQFFWKLIWQKSLSCDFLIQLWGAIFSAFLILATLLYFCFSSGRVHSTSDINLRSLCCSFVVRVCYNLCYYEAFV